MILTATDKWFADGTIPTVPDMGWDPETYGKHDYHKIDRWEYIAKYGFTLLSPELVQGMLPYGPFVEVGAGTGALANRLADAGADIVATDDMSDEYNFKHGHHFPVASSSATVTVRAHPDRTVIMSWPSYGSPWASHTLRAMAPGQRLIHIGESRGGCTADDDFFDALDKDFEEIKLLPHKRFWGLHDYCTLHRKEEP